MPFLRIVVPALVFALVGSAAIAQTGRAPARMVIGFPPGGNVDILARVFAERLADTLGRPVLVENRPGALGQLAIDVVKIAAPDGNTLMLAPDAVLTVRPHTLRKPSFNPLTDFTPVAHTGQTPMAFAVYSAIPARNLREFAGWLKANPNAAAFASPGAGGSMHFFGLLIAQELGVALRHVPYKGSGPAVADTAAGHVASTVQPLGPMLSQVRAGKLRVIGVSGAQRAASTPDAPTFTEQAHPSLNLDAWFGIFTPAGTPAEIVNRYNGVIVQALRTQAIRDRMRGMDLDIREMTPGEFAALLKRDYERWGPVVKASGFTAESE